MCFPFIIWLQYMTSLIQIYLIDINIFMNDKHIINPKMWSSVVEKLNKSWLSLQLTSYWIDLCDTKSATWSSNLLSACCPPMTKERNCHIDYLSITLYCFGWAVCTLQVCASNSQCQCQCVSFLSVLPYVKAD